MTDLEAARLVAPNMTQESLQIFVASGLFDMLYRQDMQVHQLPRQKNEQLHHDVTGFYQRKRRG